MLFPNYSDDPRSPLLWTTMTLYLLLNVHGELTLLLFRFFL